MDANKRKILEDAGVLYPSVVTNADKIRAMTDENLAILLSGMSCRRCPIDCKGGYMSCSDFWLDWLKQEYKE